MPEKRVSPENLAFVAPLAEIQKLVDFMRANGVTELSVSGVEIKLGPKPVTEVYMSEGKPSAIEAIGQPVHKVPLPNESPEEYATRQALEQEKQALADVMWSST